MVVVDVVVDVVELLVLGVVAVVVVLFTRDSLISSFFSPFGGGVSVEDSFTGAGARVLLELALTSLGALVVVEVKLAAGRGLSRLAEGTFFAVVALELDVPLIAGGPISTTGAGEFVVRSSRTRFRTDEWTVAGAGEGTAAEVFVVMFASPPPSMTIAFGPLLAVWADRIHKMKRHRKIFLKPMLTAEMITTDDWHYDWMH